MRLLRFNFNGLDEVFADGDEFYVLPGEEGVEGVDDFLLGEGCLADEVNEVNVVWKPRVEVEFAASYQLGVNMSDLVGINARKIDFSCWNYVRASTRGIGRRCRGFDFSRTGVSHRGTVGSQYHDEFGSVEDVGISVFIKCFGKGLGGVGFVGGVGVATHLNGGEGWVQDGAVGEFSIETQDLVQVGVAELDGGSIGGRLGLVIQGESDDGVGLVGGKVELRCAFDRIDLNDFQTEFWTE